MLPISGTRSFLGASRALTPWALGMALGLTLSLAIAVFGTSEAQAADPELDPDWEFGAMLGWGVHSQGLDGSSFSSTSTGTLQDNGDSLITSFFRIGGRLYTPLRAPDLMFKPRMFLTGSVYIPIAEGLISNAVDQTFNRISDPAAVDANCPISIPNGQPGPTQPPTVAPDTCSVANRNRVTMNAMWSAGLGLDLTLPIAEEQFHVLTSLEYFGQAIQGGGDFQRTSASGSRSSLIERAESVGDSVLFHGLITSLGMYVDVYETDQYKIQLHLEGRAGWKYTERDLRDTAFGDGVAVTFTSTVQNFLAQGNGGISVFWKGF